MPNVRQGALPPIPAIKFGPSIDINEVRLGTILVWQRNTLRDDFSTAIAAGLGGNWTDHGPAVAPYQAYVDDAGYARINIPDTGLVSPGVAVQTSRYRYNAAVTPIDDSYLEVKLGPMGSWRSNYISRAYIRGSNAAFTDGVGLAVASSGQVWISTLIGSAETLISLPNATAQSGDVLRLTPSNRSFVLTKNGRWIGGWTDPGTTTAKGGGFRSVLASWMGSKDGPIGVRQFSPAFDYIEAGGGVNGIVMPALAHAIMNNNTRTLSIRPGNDYAPQAGDLVLALAGNSEPNRTIVMPGDGSWTNLLGAGNTIVTTTQNTMAAIWHVVTLAEEQAGTNSWQIPNFWTLNSFGGLFSVVLRGVDPANPIDAVATGLDSANANPHILPALPGASLSDRSLVLGFLSPDQAPSYSADPAGWTKTGYYVTSQYGTRALFTRDALTQAGVNVLAANVVPSVADQYCAVTAAFNVKPNT